MSVPAISIIIPLYNEERLFAELVRRLDDALRTVPFSYEVVFVNDGSNDTTAELIRRQCLNNHHYHGVLLSRNHGHQLALTAGLYYARGTEGAMIMDGDLQDPPELISSFYEKLKEGYEVIYAVREKRKESWLKRFFYKLYYRLQRKVSNFDIPIDSGDFSMISRRVINHLNKMPESSRYLRGMRSWVGYKQIGLRYERSARHAGESNYSLKQLMQLAFNGIFNFSEFPVRIVTGLGMYSIFFSLIYLSYVLVKKLLYHNVPAGFPSLVAAIVLFSGVQMISIGILGEYILRIYNQVRERPLFIVDEEIVDGAAKKID